MLGCIGEEWWGWQVKKHNGEVKSSEDASSTRSGIYPYNEWFFRSTCASSELLPHDPGATTCTLLMIASSLGHVPNEAMFLESSSAKVHAL